MNRGEKAFMIFYWVYMAVYILCFVGFFLFWLFFQSMPRQDPVLSVAAVIAGQPADDYAIVLLPFHFLGMAMGVPMYVIVIRDVYKRTFPTPNSKVTWTILMLLLWPSILVYLYKHAFHPR